MQYISMRANAALDSGTGSFSGLDPHELQGKPSARRASDTTPSAVGGVAHSMSHSHVSDIIAPHSHLAFTFDLIRKFEVSVVSKENISLFDISTSRILNTGQYGRWRSSGP
jgi:hypothetical protein